MKRYDPEIPPNPEEWLQLDEAERLLVVERYHRDARIPLPKSARHVHAVFHVSVENQLAANDEPIIRALSRLRAEGLSRHDAIHAIGSVVAAHVHDVMNAKGDEATLRQRSNV